RSPFAHILDRLLHKLAGQKISSRQLAFLCSQQRVRGDSPVNHSELSAWRRGRHAITLPKLRSVAAGLDYLALQRLPDPLMPEQIPSLIPAAGFRRHELTDSSHDIIANIHDRTEIKPLLRAIRQATDLAIPTTLYGDFLQAWERPGRSSTQPTPQQVDDLLRS